MKIQGEEAMVGGEGKDYPHFKEFPSALLFQNQNYKTFIIYIFSYLNAMYYLAENKAFENYIYTAKKKKKKKSFGLNVSFYIPFSFWRLFFFLKRKQQQS